jgi:hypothetical protein
MEGQLFELLYALIVPLGVLRPRKKGQIFSDSRIALVLLWAALCNRPRSWALQPRNWHGRCPWLLLPSNGTLSRRSRSIGVWLILVQVFDLLNSLQVPSMFKRIDAHPLTVGGASKDYEAKCGFGAGKLAKGYKLYELRSGMGHIDGWTFCAMSDKEPVVAPRLLAQLEGGGYVTGDNGFDANDLYDLAAARNYQLIAPPREASKSRGRHPHSPYRLQALERLANPLRCCGERENFYQAILRSRRRIEGEFAHEATCPCCHMGPLPFWVRTPHRVGPWILCKLILSLAYPQRNNQHLHPA